MKKQFDSAAKVRITRAETSKFGEIRKGSFAADVQKRVDRPKKHLN
jgi:hypothetical protein